VGRHLPKGIEFADADLEATVRKRLDEVEELLLARARSDDYAFVTETSSHLVVAGGKRFRPLVTLLAAHATAYPGGTADPDAPGVVPAAVAIELTHLSTLYHDDVMDEAPLRRGAESANSRWGNTVAILTGDFLFARASEITADLGTEATRILARTIAVLCQGQIRETAGPQPGDDPVEHHLRVLREKTGSLIATSGHLGALLAGAPDRDIAVLTDYGARIGVAFQLSDDLIDVTSETDDSGKTPGTDVREGVPTLPTLLAVRDGDDARLSELLARPVAEDDVPEVLTRLRAGPGVDGARQILTAEAEGARAALRPLPDTPAKVALAWLADYVIARTG
jgi:heptaprenyl diphosphate synthase